MSLYLIDRHLLGGATSRVVKRADCERMVDAADVLAAARESAAQQQAQAEAARQEAMRAGYAAGVEMGKEAWAQQLAERHSAGQAQLRGLQETLVDVVMNSLRHLVSQLPTESRFELLAQQVLGSVVRARQMRLVVAGADASAARAVLERWQREHPDVLSIDVVVDGALTAGDCVLETDEGAIDGRLSRRLDTLEAFLARHLSVAAQAHAGVGPDPAGTAP
jgi:type III secretion protein L